MKKFPRYPRKAHKSGLARICVNGRTIYLGPFNSQESWTRYREELTRWQAGDVPVTGACVAQVVAAYLEHIDGEVAAGHLNPHAKRDAEVCFHAMVAMYGTEPVERFGPLRLSSVGQAMLTGDWITPKDRERRRRIGARCKCSRKTANYRMRKIKRAFRWAASKELIPWEVYHKLATAESFRVSKAAPDMEDVQPVDPAIVAATLPFLGPVTRAMVEIQQLTGMRSGEVCALTAEQVDRQGMAVDGVPVWIYRPTHDKQSHKRKAAPIALGPRAQTILAPLIAAAEPGKPLFSPRAEMLAIYAERRANAKHKRRKLVGLNVSRFKEGYMVSAYYKRIRAVCEREGIPHWFPYQLRHSAQVAVVRAFDLDAARAVLRHKDAKTTTRYGIIDLQKAAEVASKIG